MQQCSKCSLRLSYVLLPRIGGFMSRLLSFVNSYRESDITSGARNGKVCISKLSRDESVPLMLKQLPRSISLTTGAPTPASHEILLLGRSIQPASHLLGIRRALQVKLGDSLHQRADSVVKTRCPVSIECLAWLSTSTKSL